MTWQVEDYPAYAYIPGKNDRHAEGCFDTIRRSARFGMAPDALAQSAAFRRGLAYLDSGFFWEAHEVLEPVWMALPEGSDERRLVQALIQLANAYLKQSMARPKAARRLCAMVRELLSEISTPVIMSVDIADLTKRLAVLERQVSAAL